MEEQELIRRSLDGDRAAFTSLAECYGKALLTLCRHMTGDREEARDAAQEALLQAFQHLDRFDPQRSFAKWLLGIGAKACLRRLRQRRTFLRFFHSYSREYHCRRDGRAAEPAGDDNGRLLQALNPRERTVVTLAVLQDFSAREIGAVLGCSEKTVRVHLFNARCKLKKEVDHAL